MRVAVFAITAAGYKQARRLREVLDGADIYVKEDLAEADIAETDVEKQRIIITGKTKMAEAEATNTFAELGPTLQSAFASYDALICIMATGIVVRLLAPVIKDKLTDPAVLVMDETGRFVISLLSGHVGGANRLAEQIAEKLHATPVITTATDREGVQAPDAFAGQLALHPWPKEQIQMINMALLQGKEVHYLINKSMKTAEWTYKALERMGIQAGFAFPEAVHSFPGNIVYITDDAVYNTRVLNLLPRRLVAGVGCRAGTLAPEIIGALKAATKKLDLSVRHISMVATTVVKRNEEGLLEAAKRMGVEIDFHENIALAYQIKKYSLEESQFVKMTIGVGNVAEAAAYASVESGIRALPKTKYNNVTVALLWER
ncbi:cobalt-precorrin 5A hydrolase [Selenomonas sp. TAMA-11512]|uniref:cobalt-precorrin 5A hydrolase n=1 Tax=Selenomonas sp. TAMA-11512 TaxID=3095337 RepID=UPI003088271E|nr:cobalt-precorrin 5A hydrolase [Selenomonas sp. TAMA-11512]